MPGFIEQLGMQAAGTAIGGGMGLLLGGVERRRQMEQQRQLQEMQIQGQKQMTDYQMKQQLAMWKATGPMGQMEQLKLAGLNPGLIYGMGGAGGQTAQVAQGNVTQGQVHRGGEATAMGMQMGQTALMAAQIQNLQADANLKNAQATKTGGIDTQLGHSQIAALKQQVKSQQAQQALTEVETAIASIKEHVAGATQNLEISKIQSAAAILRNDTTISNATVQDIIDTIKAEAIGAALHNTLTRAQTRATDKGIQKMDKEMEVMTNEINKIMATIRQGDKALSLKELEIFYKNQADRGMYDDTDPVKEFIDQIILIPTMGRTGPKPIQGFKTGGR